MIKGRAATPDEVAAIQAAYRQLGTTRAVAARFGISNSTVCKYIDAHIADNATTDNAPGPEREIDELIQDRKREFDRRERSEKARFLRDITVQDHLPIGIVHIGDPHIDDPGCDIAAIERDFETIRRTPGMYAASVGDHSNNWVGRLGRLHGKQTTTEAEAWKLVEWFVGQAQGRWLWLIGGNHDYWSGAADPLAMIAARADACLQYHGARFRMTFPNGREYRANCRHDFKGSSIWNPAHAAMRAAQKGSFRDHLYTCGHLHSNAYGIIAGYGSDGEAIVSHCLRVAGYKRYDSFAHEIAAEETPKAPCAVSIIDPYAENPYCVTTIVWDVQEGADMLKWMRKRREKRT